MAMNSQAWLPFKYLFARRFLLRARPKLLSRCYYYRCCNSYSPRELTADVRCNGFVASQSVLFSFPKVVVRFDGHPKCPIYTSAVLNLDVDVKKEMESISEKFSEALELLNDARSSLGTVYFSEDMKDAEQMVEETLLTYKNLLSNVGEVARNDVQRTIGLKMEELQAQLQMIKDSLKEEIK